MKYYCYKCGEKLPKIDRDYEYDIDYGEGDGTPYMSIKLYCPKCGAMHWLEKEFACYDETLYDEGREKVKE